MMDIENRAIAIVYRTAFEYCNSNISYQSAMDILTTVERMCNANCTYSSEISRYVELIRAYISKIEESVRNKIIVMKSEAWDESKLQIESDNIVVDDSFYDGLQYPSYFC